MKIVILLISVSILLLQLSACNEEHKPRLAPKSQTNSSETTGRLASSSSKEDIKIDSNKKNWSIPVKQLSDVEYPDNPDISIRHKLYDQAVYSSLEIKKLDGGSYTFVKIPANEQTDTLILPNIHVMEWIPLAPKWLQSDEYLSYVALINQEWNRHQVRFYPGQFELRGGRESEKITRVDLARNCLNAYLWEFIIYAEEDGETKPYYHSWFNFPKDLYADLFKQRNGIDYARYREPLENWLEPENKPINLDLLREVEREQELVFQSHNDALYPLLGERKKKSVNIIYPPKATKIQDFLTDKTRYATFTPPGFYNKKTPRVTELSRFAQLEKVIQRKITGKNPSKTPSQELELVFKRSTDGSLMRWVIGGLEFSKIPQRSLEALHQGWQMSMGIANHSFYESYEEQQANPSGNNPFYALLLDEKGHWLDSHKIGIDGPLFHFDQADSQRLHLWVLSFERHSFVGHFSFNVENATLR